MFGQSTTTWPEYEQLQRRISSQIRRRLPKRDRRRQFEAILEDIHRWIDADPQEVGKRIDACGILWIGDDILVSTARLEKLFERSRPFVNDALNTLGYEFTVSSSQTTEYDRAISELVKYIPTIRENAGAQKQWTLRRRCRPTWVDALINEAGDEQAPIESILAPWFSDEWPFVFEPMDYQ